MLPLYAEWARYQARFLERVASLTPDELALRPGPDHWPVWAIVGHAAAARVYWLCHVFGEPGAATTPFRDPSGEGWEDHLESPRSASELVEALESTWWVIEDCLGRWTPTSMGETASRLISGGRVQVHSRQGVLVRLISHDAFHAGEIASALTRAGAPPLDLWPPSVPAVPPAT